MIITMEYKTHNKINNNNLKKYNIQLLFRLKITMTQMNKV